MSDVLTVIKAFEVAVTEQQGSDNATHCIFGKVSKRQRGLSSELEEGLDHVSAGFKMDGFVLGEGFVQVGHKEAFYREYQSDYRRSWVDHKMKSGWFISHLAVFAYKTCDVVLSHTDLISLIDVLCGLAMRYTDPHPDGPPTYADSVAL